MVGFSGKGIKGCSSDRKEDNGELYRIAQHWTQRQPTDLFAGRSGAAPSGSCLHGIHQDKGLSHDDADRYRASVQ